MSAFKFKNMTSYVRQVIMPYIVNTVLLLKDNSTSLNEIYQILKKRDDELQDSIDYIQDQIGTPDPDLYDKDGTLNPSHTINGKLDSLNTSLIEYLDNIWNKNGSYKDSNGITHNGGLDSKAPIYHASSLTIYGVGNNTLYGHLKLSDSTSSSLDVNDGTAATPKSVKDTYDYATSIKNELDNVNDELLERITNIENVLPKDSTGIPKKDHSSTTKEYGGGTSTKYGHVSLSDSTNSTSDASQSVAATPKAVKAAYDLAQQALNAANSGSDQLNSHLSDFLNPHKTCIQNVIDIHVSTNAPGGSYTNPNTGETYPWNEGAIWIQPYS